MEISINSLRSDITDILKDADLTQLSTKKIRLQLEAKHCISLLDRKSEIDKIVMEEIAVIQDRNEKAAQSSKASSKAASKTTSKASSSNGRKAKKEESDMEDDQEEEIQEPEMQSDGGSDDEAPSDKEDDEDIARKLQEEEENTAVRRTRGGRSSNANKSKAKPKEKKERKKGVSRQNKYTEPCHLSPDLAAILGEDRLKRCDVVKKMWAIVKERNLYDPRNKQFMICDTEMQKVFGRKKIRIFGMMKYLTNHIFKPEEVA
jgi:upstream activation factor subunit UAF30